MPFNEERRPINLGGTSTSISLGRALEEARLQRRRRQAAIRLKAWWRRLRAQRSLRRIFDEDPSTLLALLSLTLLHDDVDRMDRWSTAMVSDNGTVGTQAPRFILLTGFNRAPSFETPYFG